MDRGRYSDSVRIVQIDTHFVETDAVNFRAVVQSLTGKDSSTVWPGNGLSMSSSSSSASLAEIAAAAAAKTDGVEGKAAKDYNDNDDVARFNGGGVVAMKPGDDDDNQGMIIINKGEIKYEDDDYVLSFMKDNNLSFKDLDGLLSEFALMEELPLL